MSTFYFSLCSEDIELLAEQIMAECEAFLEAECLWVPKRAGFSPEQVHKRMARCDGLIILFGKQGTSSDTALSERLRSEIVSAMNLDILILSLLVDNAQLPEKETAQGAVKKLLDYKSYPIRSHLWFEDFHEVLEDIQDEMDFRKEVEDKLSRSVKDNYLGPVDADGKPLAPQKLGGESSGALELRRTVESEQFNLKEARRRGDRVGEKKALSALGITFTRLGQTQRAIEYFEQELVIVREMEDAEAECGLLANLGDAYAVSGHIERAKSFYEEQLCRADELKSSPYIASALNGLGFVYVKQNKIAKAIDCYSKALSLFQASENHDKELELLVGIGLNYQKLGDIQNAVRYLEQALEACKYLENYREKARILVDLCAMNLQLQNPEQAEQYCHQAHEILRVTEETWAAPWKQRLASLRTSLSGN